MAERRPRAQGASKGGRPRKVVAVPEVIAVEKNLSTLGFFNVTAPSAGSGESVERVVTHRAKVDGVAVEGRVTYVGAASQGGLPTAADQDVYLAVLAFVYEVWREDGEIPQMVALSPIDVLRRMGKQGTGSYYDALEKALLRIASTTIVSEHSLRVNDRSQFQKELFRVFDRVQIKGTRMDDGTVTAKHQIWLSTWQIENLKASHYLLIDYPTYKSLRNDISRVLFPMLKVWLYASRRAERFEKRYDELCSILGIKPRQVKSQIDQQLRSSLDELVGVGYLSRWEIVPVVAAVERAFKIVFHHHPDLLAQFAALEGTSRVLGSRDDADAIASERAQIVDALVVHGVASRVAKRLVADLEPEGLDRARRIIEYFSQVPKDRIESPAGYLVTLIREEVEPGAPRRPARAAERTSSASAEKERLEAEITAQAVRDLANMRAFEDELNRIINSLAPLELASYHRRASDQLVADFPDVGSWKAEVRDKQTQTIVRRMIAEDYEL